MTILIIYLIGVIVAYLAVGYSNDKNGHKAGIIWILFSWLIISAIFFAEYDFNKLNPSLKPFKNLFKKD